MLPGQSGWRFPAGDADALAGHLRALLADREPLARLYARSPELPSWDGMAARMEALYREVSAEGAST